MPIALVLAMVSASDGVLRGTVHDQSGLPVPRALVYVGGTQSSTETDSNGTFELRLDTPQPGVLVVFRDGFTTESLPFDPAALSPFAIVLTPAPIAESITVVAPRAPKASASAFTMRPLDVVPHRRRRGRSDAGAADASGGIPD